MASLAEIRARLQAQDTKAQGNFVGDNGIYPHWNIAEGQTAVLRFLPDADQNNPFFWVEKLVIKLPFAGIKGQDAKPVIVQVPCMEMWQEACPVLTEVRPWYKDEALKEQANKYWKKKSFLFQSFVRETPFKEDQTPENPIRRIIASTQIFTIIKAALLDPELDNLPTDYERGLDFKVTKTMKGQYGDYTTSSWSRRESALSTAELEAIQKYGLFNLREYLPKKPTPVEINVISEMFAASVDGMPYDPDRWSAYFKPAGLKGNDKAPSAASNESYSAPAPTVVETNKAPSVPAWEDDVAKAEAEVSRPAAAAPASEDKAAAILAMIRSRPKTA